jgi:hypothetical protein
MSLSPLDNSVAIFVTSEVRNIASTTCADILHALTHSRVQVVLENQFPQANNLFISSQQILIRPLSGDWCVMPVGRLYTSDAIISHSQFITDTLIIFAAFQNLMRNARSQGPEWCVSSKPVSVELCPMFVLKPSRGAMQKHDSETCDGLCKFHQGVLDSRIRECIPTALLR